MADDEEPQPHGEQHRSEERGAWPHFGSNMPFETHECVRCARCGELRICEPEFGRDPTHIAPCACVNGPRWIDATLIVWGSDDDVGDDRG
jgi:hypothetical protein